MCACGSEDNSSDTVDKESFQVTDNEPKETNDASVIIMSVQELKEKFTILTYRLK